MATKVDLTNPIFHDDIKAREHLEILGDFESAIVRQHHAAASYTDSLRGGRDGSDHHLGTGTRQRRSTVMFGQPVAMVTELVGQTRQLQSVA